MLYLDFKLPTALPTILIQKGDMLIVPLNEWDVLQIQFLLRAINILASIKSEN